MCRVKIESNGKTHALLGPAVVSLSRWLEQVGVTPCTAWRWRKKGWLKTINIAGRIYVTDEAMKQFTRRAEAGEFAQNPKTPTRPERETKDGRAEVETCRFPGLRVGIGADGKQPEKKGLQCNRRVV